MVSVPSEINRLLVASNIGNILLFGTEAFLAGLERQDTKIGTGVKSNIRYKESGTYTRDKLAHINELKFSSKQNPRGEPKFCYACMYSSL
jgi:hypothetical protein